MYLLWIGVCLGILVAKYVYEHCRYYAAAFQFSTTLPGIPNVLAGYLTMANNKFDLYQAFISIQQSGSADFSAIWFPSLTVLVRRVQLLHTLLTSKNALDKSFHYDGLKYFMGKHKEGLLTASGDDFSPCKKLFYNTFNNSSLDVLFDSLLRGADFLMQGIEREAGKPEFKMIRIARRFITRNIIDGAMGLPAGDDSPIMKIMEEQVEELEVNAVRMGVFRHFPFSESIFPFKKNLKAMRPVIHTILKTMYDQKKSEYAAMTKEEVPRQYIYNLICEVEKDDSIDICAEMTTLVSTGVTTAGLISACLELLAMHPEVQQRVYLEDQQVQAALGGRAMVDGDLADYQYLHRVVKETLRLCPSIPFFGRRAREDLKLGENTIPKGSAAAVFLPFFHRDPDNFPDPMRFDPDRFLPEEEAKRHKLAYLPFSYGQRVCPGMRYGIQSTIVAVSTVVRHYLVYTKYKTIQELDRQLRIYITLVNVEGYPIRLQRRTAADQ